MTTHAGDAPSFDLTTRPWIRVLNTEGQERLLSVRQVFDDARQILRLAGDSPQQDASLLRLLLVVFWRAHREDPRLGSGALAEASEWWSAKFLGEEEEQDSLRLSAYLDDVAPRWDLLHPSAPFMQVADLHTVKNEHSPVRKLVPEAESHYLSMRAAGGIDSLDMAEAARWLVHLQAWNYSGIKSGAIGDPRVKGGKGYPIGTGWSGRAGTVVLHGRNLAETFALNTVPEAVFSERMAQDLPVWEREPAGAAPRGVEKPSGPCDLLTWQIRRVRLFVEGDRVTGVLVANGDRVESQNEFSDPMTAYRYSEPQTKKAGHPVHMPRQHSASRTLWRGIEPLLAQGEEANTRGRPPATVTHLSAVADEEVLDENPLVVVQLVGTAYGTQDAVVSATLNESMPLRLSVLMQDIERMAPLIISAAEATMQVAIGLGQFAGSLHQAASGDYAFVPDATDSLLERLNEPFKAWLGALGPDQDAGEFQAAWFRVAERLAREQARSLVAGVSPSAIIGREDDEGRLVSAATAQFQWDRTLRKHFGPRPDVPARQVLDTAENAS